MLHICNFNDKHHKKERQLLRLLFYHANESEKAANSQSEVLKLEDKLCAVTLFTAYFKRIQNYSSWILSLLQINVKTRKEGKFKNMLHS